ncbi:MAG: hypothetical protein IT158_04500 [Bryobacterales bacterium]|nr:hypothetical protein [Bryobacterales bacterium]
MRIHVLPSAFTVPSNQQTARSFFVWDVPSTPVTVYFHYDVIDRLNEEMMRGFGALPRRGAEVGGILLGRVEAGVRNNIVIEGFDPIPCRHQTGPSFQLTEGDMPVLRERLEHWRAAGPGQPSVVGFYRTHTRKDFAMDEVDQDLCSTFFPEPSNLFLLVRPFAMRAGVAGFFFWQDGRLVREPSAQEFLFSRAELGGGVARPARPPVADRAAAVGAAAAPAAVSETETADATEPAPETASAPRPEPPPPPPAPRRRMLPLETEPAPFAAVPFPEEQGGERRLRLLWVPAALLVLAASGYIGYVFLNRPAGERSPRTAAAGPNYALQLAATDREGQLEVTWNREAPMVRSANRAVLTITDGPYRRDMELDTEQIRNMDKVVYTPVTGDVNLRLEVFAGDRSLSESVRKLKGVAAPPGPLDKPETESGALAALPGTVPARPAPAQSTPPPPASRETLPAEPPAAAQPETARVREETPEPVKPRPRAVPVRRSETVTAAPEEPAPAAAAPSEPAPTPVRQIPSPGRRR